MFVYVKCDENNSLYGLIDGYISACGHPMNCHMFTNLLLRILGDYEDGENVLIVWSPEKHCDPRLYDLDWDNGAVALKYKSEYEYITRLTLKGLFSYFSHRHVEKIKKVLNDKELNIVDINDICIQKPKSARNV